MIKNSTLDSLSPGKSGKILEITCQEDMKRRLKDMGFVRDTLITCEGEGIHGDLKAYFLRGCVVALRNSDSRHILIREVDI